VDPSKTDGSIYGQYKLPRGFSILGRNFGNLGIHDSRVSRNHLEINISEKDPITITLTLKGLNASSVKLQGASEFRPLVKDTPFAVGDGDEIAFLPDLSHRFLLSFLIEYSR